MAKRKSKGSSVSTEAAIIAASAGGLPAQRQNDAALITACVLFCASTAASDAAYDGDPTGDNSFAASLSDRIDRARRVELVKIVTTPAVGAKGLSAKARACIALVEDINRHQGMLDTIWSEVFRSFAKDVKGYLKEAIEAEYRAECEVKRGGAK